MSLNIAIGGGGISGNLAAISFAQAGHQVTIYEPYLQANTIGGFMTLWPNATAGLIQLGLGDWVDSCPRLETSQMKTWQDKPIKELPMGELAARLGAPTICVARSEFIKLLTEKLPEDINLIQAPVLNGVMADNQVEVETPDSAEKFDLLVIADGQRSRNRSLVVPDWPLNYQGRCSFHGLARVEQLEIPSNHFTEVHGRGQRFGYFKVSEALCGWYATLSMPISDIPETGEASAFLLGHYETWPAPVKHLLSQTQSDQIRPIAIHTCKPLPHWSKGHMTLMGDAAHPMTPDLGQGACQAIEDALCLPQALKESPGIEEALLAYENRRCERTAKLMNQSRIMGKVSNLSNPLLVSLRFRLLRSLDTRKSLDGFENIIRPKL